MDEFKELSDFLGTQIEKLKSINNTTMTLEEQNQQDLTYFRMNMLQAEIEMQGMIAENKQRELRGESMAYTADAFINLIEKHNIHHNKFPFAKG